MSRLCAQLEIRFGLRAEEGRAGRGLPGYSRAEAERARRERGPAAEADRVVLARAVRAYAATADSEGEFVEQLREAGVRVRLRYDGSGRGEVVGYAVALRRAGNAPRCGSAGASSPPT
jgi:hypothetical protein